MMLSYDFNLRKIRSLEPKLWQSKVYCGNFPKKVVKFRNNNNKNNNKIQKTCQTTQIPTWHRKRYIKYSNTPKKQKVLRRTRTLTTTTTTTTTTRRTRTRTRVSL